MLFFNEDKRGVKSVNVRGEGVRLATGYLSEVETAVSTPLLRFNVDLLLYRFK